MCIRRRKCARSSLWRCARAFYVTCAFLSAFSALPCRAGVDYEPFDYASTDLNGQNGSAIWGGPWTTTPGFLSNTLSNDGVSLSYPVPFEGGYTAPATSGSRVSTGGFGSIASN